MGPLAPWKSTLRKLMLFTVGGEMEATTMKMVATSSMKLPT